MAHLHSQDRNHTFRIDSLLATLQSNISVKFLAASASKQQAPINAGRFGIEIAGELSWFPRIVACVCSAFERDVENRILSC